VEMSRDIELGFRCNVVHHHASVIKYSQAHGNSQSQPNAAFLHEITMELHGWC